MNKVEIKDIIREIEKNISTKENENKDIFKENINILTDMQCQLDEIKEIKESINFYNEKIENLQEYLEKAETILGDKTLLKLKRVVLVTTYVICIFLAPLIPHMTFLALLLSANLICSTIVQALEINKAERVFLAEGKPQQKETEDHHDKKKKLSQKFKSIMLDLKRAYQTKGIISITSKVKEEQMEYQSKIIEYQSKIAVCETEYRVLEKKNDKTIESMQDNEKAIQKMKDELLKYYRYITNSISVSVSFNNNEKSASSNESIGHKDDRPITKIKYIKKIKKVKGYPYNIAQLKEKC